MDKVKKILEQLQKYHFWILCGVAALVGLISWSLASSSLNAEFTTNKGKIDQEIGLLTLQPDQPRTEWTPFVSKITEAQRKNVKEAWEKLWDQQTKEVFLPPKAMGDDFVEAFEKVVNSKEKIELPDTLRERYMRRVPDLVSPLATLVDSQPFNPPGGGAGVQPVIPPNVVGAAPTNRIAWDPKSQQDILDSFTWEKAPTTLMVRYMQEELWVYQALCSIIADMNKGSKGPYDASVREINDLAIAYNAVQDPVHGGQRRWADSLVPVSTETASTTDAAKTRFKPEDRGKEAPLGGGTVPADPNAAPTNSEDAWKNGRYVTDAGAPVDGAAVDTADTEFNLMPFRLTLRVDAREIDKLLLLFRNSTLPFEIQEVRINGQSGTGNQGSRAPVNPPPVVAGGPAQAFDHFVTLELHGVAYLVKPVDPVKLHLAPPVDPNVAPPADGQAPAGDQNAAAPGGPAAPAPGAGTPAANP